MDDKITQIHKSFIQFQKRTERNEGDILVETFVDTEPLVDFLQSPSAQIMYGRRGTGKTHALKYLEQIVQKIPNSYPIFIDLRTLGSDGSIYQDASKPLSQRSVRIVIDVLRTIADELLELALQKVDNAPHPDQITKRVDDLYKAISEVEIVGEITQEAISSDDAENSVQGHASIKVSAATPTASLGAKAGATSSHFTQHLSRQVGQQKFHLHFSNIHSSLTGLIAVLGKPKIWLLIDEWSEVPLNLQPYLADLFRKTILPINNIIVKIASIEHRSQFSLPRQNGGYIGIELGADMSAELNLDDFLVFDNNKERSVDFFKKLLFKHYVTAIEGQAQASSPDKLIQDIFTQQPVFEEFVRAVEGVPRDALHLASVIALKRYGQRVDVNTVRTCARDWYQQDKATLLKDNNELETVLNFIIEEVIGQRRARAFMFPANEKNEYIERLFDARILHVLKKNISSHDAPGKRFDSFKIDYGCYVELINTAKAPLGLFEADERWVEVPADDYRSIRRAILDPEQIDKLLQRTS